MHRYRFPKGELNPAKRLDVRLKISKSKLGPKNPNWKQKITVRCKICGKTELVIPSRAKSYRTCSKKCLYKLSSIRMKKNNPMKNVKTIQKQVETQKKSKFAKNGGVLKKLWTTKRSMMLKSVRKRMCGPNNPMKDPKIAEKVAQKNRKALKIKKKCKVCGNEFIHTIFSNGKPHGKGIYCSHKCYTKDPKHRAELSLVAKKRFQNPEYKKRILYLQTRRPNKLEINFLDMLKTHSLPFRYVGDKSFWLGPCQSGKCRNPDFIHETKKIVILIGARYWRKGREYSIEIETNDYVKLGYIVLRFWQEEIMRSPQKIIKQIRCIA